MGGGHGEPPHPRREAGGAGAGGPGSPNGWVALA
jgi:hypothetical protein